MKHWFIDPKSETHVISEDRPICSISFRDGTERAREENREFAHLIASAPDLLEALEEMIDRERRKYGRSELAQKIFRTNNAAALEITARARGEQS